MDKDAMADRLIEQVKASPAILSEEQMYNLEDCIQKDQSRRIAFAVAKFSGKELCEKIVEDRNFAVAAAGVFSDLEAVEGRYQELVDLFSTLHARLLVALCLREDVNAVLEEGMAARTN